MSSAVLILTRQCQIRCPYCHVKKGGGAMSRSVLEKAIDAATHPANENLHIQFFGGEPLLEKENLVRCVETSTAAARERPVSYFLTTNAIALDSQFVEWTTGCGFTFEISIDGGLSEPPGAPKQAHIKQAAAGLRLLIDSAANYFVTMVVTPATAHLLTQNFHDILSLGAANINISPATGVMWDKKQLDCFAQCLWEIHNQFLRHKNIRLVNLEKDPETMLFSREITIDTDGSIYSGNAFLYSSEETARAMLLGHVNDNLPISSYYNRRLPLSFYIENIFSRRLTLNYHNIIKIMQSFQRFANAQKDNAPPDSNTQNQPPRPGAK